MIRLGLQIPNFTYPDIFETVATTAITAEANGFDSIFVMDHFYQLPMLGPSDAEMLEAYTLLGAIAARTKTARLGTLVTGVTYRNPAMLAKQITTLDVISGGRAILGIGAAWNQEEHDGLGFAFPPVGERMDRLEEALQICRAMFTSHRSTFVGKHYQTKDAINAPAPIQPGGPPIMVGGSGEKRTLKLAAQYADAVNLIAGRDELPHKLEVLAKHCADAGRDLTSINKTWLGNALAGATEAEATALLDDRVKAMGMGSWDSLDDSIKQALDSRLLVGTPEAIAAKVAELLPVGLDGVILNFPFNTTPAGIDAIAATGRAIRAAID